LVIAGGLLTAPIAIADASRIVDPDTLLVSSGSPLLLEPISSEGRKAWNCIAERAATSSRSQDAALPSAGQH
jgi:hypothetical protein